MVYFVLNLVSDGEKANDEEDLTENNGLEKLYEETAKLEEAEANKKKMVIVDYRAKVDQTHVNQVKEVTKVKEEKPSPWITMLNVEDININFEIDCGSDVTLIPLKLSKVLLPRLKLEPCNVQ